MYLHIVEGGCVKFQYQFLPPSNLNLFHHTAGGWDRYSDKDSGRDRYSSGGRNSRKPGDWDCPSCKFINYASRTACLKCRIPKGEYLIFLFCTYAHVYDHVYTCVCTYTHVFVHACSCAHTTCNLYKFTSVNSDILFYHLRVQLPSM